MGWWLLVEPHELINPGQAHRSTESRTSSGREIGELAEWLGISYEAHGDLERFDEEIVDTLSFDQLVRLCHAIGLDPRSFFDAGNLGTSPSQSLPPGSRP